MDIRSKKEEINRDRGILTPQDRRILCGMVDLEDESIRQARQRMRDRIKDSIRDFWFIRYTLSEKDRNLIADDLFASANPLWQGYVDALAFFYSIHSERGHSMATPIFNAVQSVEKNRHRAQGETVDVEVTFDVDVEVVLDHEELKEQFEAGEPMTPEQVQVLLIESDEYIHLSIEERWEKFARFLDGELDNEVVIEHDTGDVKML